LCDIYENDGLYLCIIPYILTILALHNHRHIQSVVACIFFDQKEEIGIAEKDETRYIHLGSFYRDKCTPIKPHIHTYIQQFSINFNGSETFELNHTRFRKISIHGKMNVRRFIVVVHVI
jgi:hypothetical protein